MSNLAINYVSAGLDNLEPVDVAHRLARFFYRRGRSWVPPFWNVRAVLEYFASPWLVDVGHGAQRTVRTTMIVVVLLRGENHPAHAGSEVNPVTFKRSSRGRLLSRFAGLLGMKPAGCVECLTKSRFTIDRQEADVSNQRPQHARLDS
jgi:hypothetical protein